MLNSIPPPHFSFNGKQCTKAVAPALSINPPTYPRRHSSSSITTRYWKVFKAKMRSMSGRKDSGDSWSCFPYCKCDWCRFATRGYVLWQVTTVPVCTCYGTAVLTVGQWVPSGQAWMGTSGDNALVKMWRFSLYRTVNTLRLTY